MIISNIELEKLGLSPYPKKPWIWGDYEDLEFNNKTGELFFHSCVNGDLDLYCKVKDIEGLKQAIYDGFPFLRDELNLD